MKLITENIIMIEQTKITKASVKWDTLRTSIPRSVTNILHLNEGEQLAWSLVTTEGKNYILLSKGEPKQESTKNP